MVSLTMYLNLIKFNLLNNLSNKPMEEPIFNAKIAREIAEKAMLDKRILNNILTDIKEQAEATNFKYKIEFETEDLRGQIDIRYKSLISTALKNLGFTIEEDDMDNLIIKW